MEAVSDEYRDDGYALCALLYWLVLGRVPYETTPIHHITGRPLQFTECTIGMFPADCHDLGLLICNGMAHRWSVQHLLDHLNSLPTTAPSTTSLSDSAAAPKYTISAGSGSSSGDAGRNSKRVFTGDEWGAWRITVGAPLADPELWPPGTVHGERAVDRFGRRHHPPVSSAAVTEMLPPFDASLAQWIDHENVIRRARNAHYDALRRRITQPTPSSPCCSIL